MSYPKPPGLPIPSSAAPGTTTHSLPPRPSGPPPSLRAFNHASAASGAPSAAGISAGATSAFAFRPRQVAASAPQHQAPPQHYQQQQSYHAPAYSNDTSGYGQQVPYGQQHHQQHAPYQQQQHAAPPTYNYGAAPAAAPTTPHIVNPFPLPGQPQYGSHSSYAGGSGGRANRYNNMAPDPRYPPLDPELEAQIAQQQSAYIPADQQQSSTSTHSKSRNGPGGSITGANSISLGPLNPAFSTATPGMDDSQNSTPQPTVPANGTTKQPTVIRHGGGQTWSDSSLLEWDPAHFRLFVGNLAGEVTDDSLLKAFSKYTSVQKARVIRDKRTTKSKGYGFVSFSDGDEYFKAAREMNGKYIGSHPVLLKRSNTEIRPVVPGDKKGKKFGAGGGGGGNGGTGSGGTAGGAGVKKKKKKQANERKVLG